MKTNKKVLAGAMAILLATGGMTNKAFAEEDKRPYEVNPPTIDQDVDDIEIFKTKEEAERAAKKALENDPVNNWYELSYLGDLWYYKLIVYEDYKKPEPEKQDDSDKKTSNEEPEKEPTEEENKALDENLAKVNALPELTVEEKVSFEAKLKEVSKDEKAMTDILAEAQKLNEERVEAKKKTEVEPEKKPEPDKKVEKDDKPVVKEKNEVGFTTKEDAEKAAKEALKDDKINNSYNVSQGRDGKYYYVLSPVVEETQKKEQVKQKPVVNNNAKHAAPNPKTGVVSLSSVGTLLAAASTAYFGTKKRK